jgi:hypothetical protein
MMSPVSFPRKLWLSRRSFDLSTLSPDPGCVFSISHHANYTATSPLECGDPMRGENPNIRLHMRHEHFVILHLLPLARLVAVTHPLDLHMYNVLCTVQMKLALTAVSPRLLLQVPGCLAVASDADLLHLQKGSRQAGLSACPASWLL